MSLLSLAAALLVASGAALALRTTDARIAALGTTAAVLLAPFVADPLPDGLALAVRLVAGLLAGFLLLVPVGRAAYLLSSMRLGGTAEAVFVAAAFLVGLLAGSVASEAAGPVTALAAAFALLLGGLDLLFVAEDGARLASGTLLSLTGASLALTALGGTQDDAVQMAIALSTVAFAAAGGWLTMAMLGVRGELAFVARHGDLRDVD